MKKIEKITLVENLTKELKEAKSVVLINYTGLTVKSQQELKARLKEAGAKMLVVKNTLLKRAAEAVKLDPELLSDDILSGQTAIVIGTEDAVAPIQVLGKFAKEFTSAAGDMVPKFKVGIVEDSFQDNSKLLKISELPGRDALLGQLLGSLMSGLYGLVGTLQSPMQQLLYTLSAKKQRNKNIGIQGIEPKNSIL